MSKVEKSKNKRGSERRASYQRGKYGVKCIYLEKLNLVTGDGYCALRHIPINIDKNCGVALCNDFFWGFEKRGIADRRHKKK